MKEHDSNALNICICYLSLVSNSSSLTSFEDCLSVFIHCAIDQNKLNKEQGE